MAASSQPRYRGLVADQPKPSSRPGSTTAAMEVYDELRPQDSGEGLSAGLVLLYAPGFEQLSPAYPLRGREVFIGRESPAEILIPQPAVSRTHARLSFDGQWTISDLGARNGTIVNGTFVQGVVLHHLDVIRIGDGFFKFVEADAEGYLPYRIDGVVRNAPATPSGIVGGYQLARIATALERIAHSEMSVVILGDSGTGKEVFARQVHAWSGRKGAFCAVNCAAIPATLLESELFGYRRGAFSGADRDHVGLVRAADGGTLFLDEVGDMALEAQAKLLRVLQTKEVLPLGARAPEHVDVRVLCATHQDLAAMQTKGTFRGDLFARLNEYSVTLPPLRARKEDIYALCRAFLQQHKRPDLLFGVPYMTGLLHYDFPYNVRELEALIKRGVALADSGALRAEHLSSEIHARMRGYGQRAHAPGEAARSSIMPVPTARPPAPSWAPHAAAGPGPAPPAGLAPPPAPAPGYPRQAYGMPVVPETPRVAAPPTYGVPPAPPAPTPPYDPEMTAPALVPPPGAFDPPAAAMPPQAPQPATAPRMPIPPEEELRGVLAHYGGNVAAVGRHYGKERMQIHRWMKRYQIDPNQYR